MPATVNFTVDNNSTWQDALQFDDEDDLTWSLTGMHFIMSVKTSSDDSTSLFSLSDDNGRIVIDDVTKRVIHFNVPSATIISTLPPAIYVYDLVMFDESAEPVRTVLTSGTVTIVQGVTQESA